MALEPNLSQIIADAIQPHLNEINNSNISFRQIASQHNENVKQIIGQIYNAINYNNNNISNIVSSIEQSSSQSQQISQEIRNMYSAMNQNNIALSSVLNELRNFNNTNRQNITRQNNLLGGVGLFFNKFTKSTLVSLGNLGKFITGRTLIGSAAIKAGGAIAALGGAAAGAAAIYAGGKIKDEYERVKGAARESAEAPGPSEGPSTERPSGGDAKKREGSSGGVDINQDIGALSAKYESGGRGVGFISSGRGDPGGQSYGTHQLSSAYSMGAFLRSTEGKPYASYFSGLRPGSPQFNEVYRRIAKQSPKEFEQAQKSFFVRTHYNPLLEEAKKLGYDVNNRGIQEALFSMSIQHAKAKSIIERAAKGGLGKTADEQLRSLYKARRDYVAGLNTLPEGTKRSVLRRYENEEKDALEYSRQSESDKKQEDAKKKQPESKPETPTPQSQTQQPQQSDGEKTQSPQTLNENINYSSPRIKKQAQLSPETISALNKLKSLQDFTVTSTTGGMHSIGSLHYKYTNPEKTGGRAVDIRINNLSIEKKQQLIENARKAGFNRIGISKNHLHLDMKPGDFTVFDEGGGARAFGKDAKTFQKELEQIPVIKDEPTTPKPSGTAEETKPIPPSDAVPKPEQPKPQPQQSAPTDTGGMLKGLDVKGTESGLRGAQATPTDGATLNAAATQREIDRVQPPTQQQQPPQQEQPQQPQQNQPDIRSVSTQTNMASRNYAALAAYYGQSKIHTTDRESVTRMA